MRTAKRRAPPPRPPPSAGRPDVTRSSARRGRRGRATPGQLAAARSRRSADRDASLREREVDEDPGYQDRLREIRDALGAMSPRKAKVLPFRGRGSGRQIYALAALLVLSLGLGGAVVYQQRRMASLEEELRGTPHLNLPVLWLTADERVRGPEDAFVLSPEARRLALVLEVASPKIFARYRVAVTRGREREEVWTSDELVKVASEVSFDLPRPLLRTGGYEIRIYGLTADSAPELLEEYEIWLRTE